MKITSIQDEIDIYLKNLNRIMIHASVGNKTILFMHIISKCLNIRLSFTFRKIKKIETSYNDED